LKKRIAILGSTGSIGCQALNVIRQQSDYFSVEVLSANTNASLLIEQAIEFKPNVVVIAEESLYQQVFTALDQFDIKVYAGEQAISQVVEMDTIDQVLNAIVGFAGLKPTLATIESKKQLALANKESLVIAGKLIQQKALENRVQIIPVDSEHSAVFQCLMGELTNPIEKIVLTASGGPFRKMDLPELVKVTPEMALDHPVWKMGKKVSIDSATLMNKGFEAIEAYWLFDLQATQIEVLVHPESVIHSMVYFTDGSVKTLMSKPDMLQPIQFALSYPNRFETKLERLDLTQFGSLNFEPPNVNIFRNLALAFEAMKKGGNQACILNAANEIAVQAFLNRQIDFLEIAKLNEHCLSKVSFINDPTLDDLYQTDKITRLKAQEYIQSID
jgi:1-deoxy-D-xylulose-5-phosphate reductoisomerase